MAQELKHILEYCSHDVVDCLLEKDPETYLRYRELYDQARNYGASIAFRVMDSRDLSGDLAEFALTLGIKKIYFFGNNGNVNSGGVHANLAEYDERKSRIGLNLGLIHYLQPLLYTYYGISTGLFKNIALAHELFHHLETRYYTRTDLFLRDKFFKKRGPFKTSVFCEGLEKPKGCPVKPVKGLREFAASGFAETILNLPFPARIIDIFRLYEDRGAENIDLRLRRVLKAIS
jgi:hypothetical protein